MKSPVLFVLTVVAVSVAACAEQSDPLSVNNASKVGVSQNGKQTVYDVTHLSSLGGTSSGGNSINNPREVAGSSNLLGDQTTHAALWQDGSLIDLGTFGGPNSNVAWPGQNNGGMIVGIAETATMDSLGEDWSCWAFFPSVTGHTCLGFVWESGVMTPLPTLGGNNGFATGVNSRGQVVGWAENTVHDPTCNSPQVLQFRAVMWEPKKGGIQELPPLPGDSTSAATAINNRGQVVGISGSCDIAVGRFSAAHAVLWEKGTATDIGNLGGVSWNTPMAINQRGDVVGFSNPPGDEDGSFNAHAFLWTESGGIQDLGTLPGDRTSQALGINAQGQVVGVSRGPGGSRAFLWQDGVLTDLNDFVAPGYSGRLLYAGDINDAGVITGAALDPATGETLTFVATPTRGHR